MSGSFRARACATVSLIALSCAFAASSASAQVYFPPQAAYQQLPADVTTITAGPHAYYIAPIASLFATQANLGAFEVAKKGANDTPPYGKDAGYYPVDGLTPGSPLPIVPGSVNALNATQTPPGPNYNAYMLGQTTPVVIGPGGKLYATDKQHTDLAVYLGYKNVPNFTPYAYLLVTANYSNLSEAAFEQTLSDKGLVLLENNGAPIAFSQLPASLLQTGNDNYRALEYEVIKNKYPFSSLSKAQQVGADKADVPYFEFIVADSYRKAGLRYLSGADAEFAANYSLTASNFLDANRSKLIPGFILPKNTLLNLTQPITDATLAGAGSGFAQTAAIDDKGGFTGLVTSNGGLPTFTGLLIQTGNDLGGVVQLSGVNTYHGGTVIQAGTLRVSSDANLGDPSGALLFRSIGEGNGTLQAGGNLVLNRAIDVQAESATIDPAGYQITLNGVISGTAGLTLGNQSNSPGNAAGGIVTLNGINTTEGAFTVKNGITLQISNDANLGNNNFNIDPNGFYVGALNLGASTLQTLAAVNSQRAVNVTGAAQINPFGFNSTFGALSVTDTTLTIGDKAGAAAGSTTTTFQSFAANGGTTLAVDNTNAGAGNTTTVQLGSVARAPVIANYVTPFASTLTINSVTGALGATALVKVTTAPTVTNGIVDAGIVGQVGATTTAYDFLTYGAANGFQTATYAASLAAATPTSVVKTGTAVVNAPATAYALDITGTTALPAAVTGAGGLKLGNGAAPAGLILNNGTLSLPTLAVGGSELVVTASGTNTINSVITGANGLTKGGTGALTLGVKENITGSVSVNGGTLTLGVVDTLASAQNGANLSPAATIALSANNTLAGLNGAGTVKTNGNTLTVGQAGSNVYSLSNATIGAGDAGALTVNGPATLEITGGSLNYTGLTTVNTGATLRLKTTVLKAATTNDIVLNGGSLMFDQSGGGLLTNNVTGTGDLKVLSGSMTLLPNKANTYSGGTNIFYGGTLYASVAALPTGGKISNDGSIFLDQNVASTFTGVISDYNRPGFGRVVIDDSYDAYNCTGSFAACAVTTANGGASYTRTPTGNITFANQQAYTGSTVINYGTLTLGAVDTIKASIGVAIWPGATLALGANNQIAQLTSGSTTTATPGGSVLLGANTLTIGDGRNLSGEFDGVIAGKGNVATGGAGTVALAGTNTYSGTTTVNSGILALVGTGSLANSTVVVAPGATFVDAATNAAGPNVGGFTNNGVLNLRNGTTPGTIFTVGGIYNGGPGSVLQINTNLGGPGSASDRLVIAGATGQTAIQVTDTAPNLPGVYNPGGIAVVVSTGPNSATNASNFVLAGGPIQKGLFQYSLAYQPDPQFLLVGTPGAAAFQLATLPTATQSIWNDTASLWFDRQADLRDRLAEDPNDYQPFAPKAGSAAALGLARSPAYPGVWAQGIGSFAHRSETQTFTDLNVTTSAQSGYQLNTGGVFGGFDATMNGVVTGRDALTLGVIGGYINSTQTFSGIGSAANYEGGSIGATATYYTHNFFLDAMFKTDVLQVKFNAPTVGGGANAPTTTAISYGGIVDAGYRFRVTPTIFLEPIGSLAYVTSDFGRPTVAGALVSFNGNDSLRGRLGARIGSSAFTNEAYRIEVTGSASYWDKLNGNASVTINSGAGAPLLTLNDHQVQGYGELGVGMNVLSLTNGFSGFVKGEYRFASGYNAGTVKGGVRYDF